MLLRGDLIAIEAQYHSNILSRSKNRYIGVWVANSDDTGISKEEKVIPTLFI